MTILKKITKIISALALMVSVISITTINTTQVHADQYGYYIDIALNPDGDYKGYPVHNEGGTGWSVQMTGYSESSEPLMTITLTSSGKNSPYYRIGYLDDSGTINSSIVACKCTVVVGEGTYLVAGTFNNTVTNNGTLGGGTYNGEVINNGTIDNVTNTWEQQSPNYTGGTYTKTVTNNGTINTGIYTEQSTVTNKATISGGTFSGTVTNSGTDSIISAGTYNGSVTNEGTISKGTFNGNVTNSGSISYVTDQNNHNLRDLDFTNTCTLTNAAGGKLYNAMYECTVVNNGEVFEGQFTNQITQGTGTIAVVFFDNCNGSTASSTQMVQVGHAISSQSPTKEYSGYTWDNCWYTDATMTSKYDTTAIITSPFVLYAGFAATGVQSITLKSSDEDVTGKSIDAYFNQNVKVSAECSPSEAANKSITWSFPDNKSDSSIRTWSSDDSSIQFSIGTNETAKSIKLTATSTANSSVSSSVTINIQQLEYPIDTSHFVDQTINVDQNAAQEYITLQTLQIEETPAITYGSSDPSVATIDKDGNVTVVGGGVTELSATIPAAGPYATKTETRTLTVNKLTPEFSFDKTEYSLTVGYKGTPFILSYPSDYKMEKGALSYSKDNPGDGTHAYINPDTGEISATYVGDIVIHATLAETARYASATATATVHVEGLAQTFDTSKFAGGDYSYGTKDNFLTVSVTNTTGSTIEYSSDNPAVVIDMTSGKLDFKGVAKNVTITATAKENGNYKQTSISCTVNVTKGIPELTIPENIAQTYDGSPVTVGASNADINYSYNGDGNLIINWYMDNGGSAGDILQTAPTDRGTYWLGIGAEEGTNWSGVVETKKQCIIDPKSITIKFDDITKKSYIGSKIEITPEVKMSDGTVLDSINYDVINGDNLDAGTNAGSVTVSQKLNGNYSFITVNKYFNIIPATLNVTAISNSKIYGQNDPDLSYTSSGYVGNDINNTGSVLSGNLERKVGENHGTYAINQGSLKANDNYSINFTSADFTITPADISLLITADQTLAKPGKTVAFTIQCATAANNLKSSGWSQPTGLKLTYGSNQEVTLTPNGTTYTGTYTIPTNATVGSSLSFAASVEDDTGNYTNPVSQIAEVTVAGKSDPVLTISASKTDVTYGDSVTYTVKTSNANDTAHDVSGTVSFYTGENADTLHGTVTIANGSAQITLYRAQLPAGTIKVTAVYNGDSEFAKDTESCSTIVNPKQLSWDITNLHSDKTYDGSDTAEITGTLYVNGTIENESAGFTYTADSSTAHFDSTDAGSRTVTMTVSNPQVGKNYALPIGSPTYSGTIYKAAIAQPSLEQNQFSYTGNVIAPVLNQVTSGNLTLTESDYDKGGDLAKTPAGSYTLTVKGKGNFTGSFDLPWSIAAIDGSVSVSLTGWTYGDTANTPAPLITTGDYTNPTYQYKSTSAESYGDTVPTEAGTYNIKVTYAKTNNYYGTSAESIFTITPRALTASITGTTTKVYDGNTNTNNDLAIQLSDVVNGDDVSAYAAYVYADKNVSTSDLITATINQTLTGTKSSNYTLSNATATITGSITAKPVKVDNITAKGKTYDGTTAAVLVTKDASFDGLVSGESLTVSATGTFADANVGIGKTVTITIQSLTNNDLHNYKLADDGQQSSATADITAAPLTVTAVAASKNYGQIDPVLSYSSEGWVNGETSASMTGALTRDPGENVGTYTITQGNLSASNYAITYQPAKLTINTSPATLSISVDKAEAKAKDTVTIRVSAVNSSSNLMTSGYNLPAVALTGPDSEPIDLTHVSGTSGQYTGTYTIPAGKQKDTVLTFNAALQQTSNYTGSAVQVQTKVLPSGEVTLTVGATNGNAITYGTSNVYAATIEKKSGITAAVSGTISFYLGTDTTGTAYATKTIGTDALSINLDHTTLTSGEHIITVKYSGDDNYGDSSASYTTTVSKKELTASITGNTSKVYDGSNAINGLSITLSGIVDGDEVNAAAESYTFDRKNITARTITANNISFNGAQSGNYTCDAALTTNGSITPKPVKVSGITANEKTYDGNTSAVLDTTKASFDGIVLNEKLSVSAAGTFGDANVGTSKTVQLSSLSLGGDDYANYVLASEDQQAETSASITAKQLTVNADAKTKKYGEVDSSLTYTSDGWVKGETADSKMEGKLERVSGEDVGTYAITSTLSAANYEISYTGANLIIEPADITLTAQLDQTSAKPGKTVTITVTALHASGDLMQTGWAQPGGVSLKTGDTTIDLTPAAGTSGTYTGTYTIPADKTAGTVIPFTAAVDAGTTNYNNPSAANSSVTVLAMSGSSMTLTPSKTENVIYGDSITYTAALNSIDDTEHTPGGTISFYLGTDTTGTAYATQTIGKDELSISLDPVQLNKGSHVVTAVYSGDGEFTGTKESCTTTVLQKKLTWDTSNLSSEKVFDGTVAATIAGTLNVLGKVGNDELGFSYSTANTTAEYEDSNAGTKTVTMNVSDAAITNDNYTLPSEKPTYTGTITAIPELPAPKEKDPDGNQLKLEMDTGIQNVVQDIVNADPTLNTPDKVEERLKTSVEAGIGTNRTEINYFELTLWVSADNGSTWNKATTENYPSSGINVVIPWSDLTMDYQTALVKKFNVTHMFASSVNGHTPGTTETPVCTIERDGLHFKVDGLSPFAIGYKSLAQITFDGNGGTASVSSAYVNQDNTLDSLAAAERSEYTFNGWFTAKDGGTEVTKTTVFDQDTTVYAHWTKIAVPELSPAPEQKKEMTAMMRLYNPNSGEHFYTANEEEKEMLTDAGWTYEGIGWTAPASGDPVYRFYNENAGEHHFTMSEEEKEMLIEAGWTYEGIGWYSDPMQAVPVYREYNPNQFADNHNFTCSLEENDYLVSMGWRYEGIAWYGVK